MGGVAGGMAHLYNAPSLTFNGIKKIIEIYEKRKYELPETSIFLFWNCYFFI